MTCICNVTLFMRIYLPGNKEMGCPHIKHYLEVNNCSNFDYKFTMPNLSLGVVVVGLTRWLSSRIQMLQYLQARLTKMPRCWMSNWPTTSVGVKVHTADGGWLGVFFNLASLEDLGEDKENFVTFGYDILVHLVVDIVS